MSNKMKRLFYRCVSLESFNLKLTYKPAYNEEIHGRLPEHIKQTLKVGKVEDFHFINEYSLLCDVLGRGIIERVTIITDKDGQVDFN